jgi:hypothetical protein
MEVTSLKQPLLCNSENIHALKIYARLFFQFITDQVQRLAAQQPPF